MKEKIVLMIFSVVFCFFYGGSAVAEEMKDAHKPHQHRHMKYAAVKNPVAMTAQSIAKGKKLYDKNCITCHGDAGKGGIGPDLRGPMRIHGDSDGEIFHVITDGVKGTAKKGFKKELTEEMRWHLVNYVKSFRNAQEAK